MAKWALITGASAGIGQATAKALAKLDYNLILTGRRKDRLEKLAQELHPCDIRIANFDLQKRSEVESFLKTQRDLLPSIEILVNNAGLAKGTEKMQEAKIEDWETMIDTNIKGLLYLTRGVLPFMIEKERGHIVNLGSVAGRLVYPGGGVYCATKFAVRALSEGLRMDLQGKNIRVTNIEPGMADTEFSTVRLGSKTKADAVYAGMKPLTAEDIAETIVWTVTRPAHVNIQELVIYPTDQASVGMVYRR